MKEMDCIWCSCDLGLSSGSSNQRWCIIKCGPDVSCITTRFPSSFSLPLPPLFSLMGYRERQRIIRLSRANQYYFKPKQFKTIQYKVTCNQHWRSMQSMVLPYTITLTIHVFNMYNNNDNYLYVTSYIQIKHNVMYTTSHRIHTHICHNQDNFKTVSRRYHDNIKAFAILASYTAIHQVWQFFNHSIHSKSRSINKMCLYQDVGKANHPFPPQICPGWSQKICFSPCSPLSANWPSTYLLIQG